MRTSIVLPLLAILAMTSVAQAQTADQKRRTGAQQGTVSTQPSNNPFVNPLGQPIPPAVSVNPAQNTGRTNVPVQR